MLIDAVQALFDHSARDVQHLSAMAESAAHRAQPHQERPLGGLLQRL